MRTAESDFQIDFIKKNTPKRKLGIKREEKGFYRLDLPHREEEPLAMEALVDQQLIQFYFAEAGAGQFLFHGGRYKLPLAQHHSLLIYNPNQPLPLEIALEGHSRLLVLFLTVERLHQYLVDGAGEIAFLRPENQGRKFYREQALTPALQVALRDFFTKRVQGPAAELYRKGKCLEILALYFHRREDLDLAQCPFLGDEENVARIRQAKRLLIDRLSQPPTLKELALEIGLNEYKLKEGFKNIYGKTVFQFLNDYRLDTARQLLDQGSVRVNDAAYQIGYANPSHFIAAFRKKFGVTPKKYLLKNS